MQLIRNISLYALLALGFSVFCLSLVSAKEFSLDRGAFWDVYAPDGDEICWLVSLPLEKRSVHTRGGRLVSVSRGDVAEEIVTALYVVFDRKNKDNLTAHIAFTGGAYRFSDDRADMNGFTILVDKTNGPFPLAPVNEKVSSGNRGWAFSFPSSDDLLVSAFKKGGEVEVTSISARGTISKDYFSLIGFSSALDDVRKRCS